MRAEGRATYGQELPRQPWKARDASRYDSQRRKGQGEPRPAFQLEDFCYCAVNLSTTSVEDSMGVPFKVAGLYFHCFTAFTAESRSMMLPLTTFTSATLPCLSILTVSTTFPSRCMRLAVSG